MSKDGPYIHAWCSGPERAGAFIAALDDPADNGWRHEFNIESIDPPFARWSGLLSFDEIAAAMRAHFAPGSHVATCGCVKLTSGRALSFDLHCYNEGYTQKYAQTPLEAQPGVRDNLLPYFSAFAIGGPPRSVEIEAAIFTIRTQQDTEDLFLRICAPHTNAGVTTAICVDDLAWLAPIQACATYHSEAATVARDLALSWIRLHDHGQLEIAAGLSLADLREQMMGAPPDARVTVAKDTTLSREAILKAINAPPADLLEALAAAVVPDEEWRAVEPIALESIAATRAGVETYEATVTSRRHLHFIEQHAPYHVRRLPNGGVMLATHPYRTLWPLWQDALLLLGITA
jgi:hypothetical protein